MSSQGFFAQHGNLPMTKTPTHQKLEQRIKELPREAGELKRAGEAIQEAEEKYRTLFNESKDAIYITSREGKFLDINHALLELFGYTREEMIDKLDVMEIYEYPGDRETFQQEIEKKGSVRDYEVKFKKKNGTQMDCLLTGTVRRSNDGSILGYQGIIRDVTEQKRIERLRDDVHRMMRHDLKSPLIGIMGLAGLLLKAENLTEKQRKETSMIKELGERMLGFIERTRDLFQMEEDSYKLYPREVDLLSVLRRIEKALGPLALRKRTNLLFTLFGLSTNLETGYVILGEETLLEIMFANLIKNAIEASPEGGTISVSIDAKGEPGGTFHVIDIHNMGVVPMEICEKFFDPYTTKGKEGGTGLGTHNALLVARTHKGNISFITSEQEGTHVTVRLPENLA
jgi:PAS domain S-box-containing protein